MASLIVIAGLAYLGLCAWVYATQRAQMYFPTPVVDHPGAQALWIESAGERIKVWAIERPGPGALLYFGGNAEDVAGNLDLFAAALPDRSLYLVNYRGYGGSSGQPAEAGLVADALAVFDHVRRKHAETAAMGRSLGSGIAVQLASARPVERLVLVTAYDSLVNVARDYFRWLPVGVLLRDRYDSAQRAPTVTVPVLIVIAAEDEIIPRARSQALASAFAPEQLQVVIVPGVGHNTLDLSPAYLGAVRGFLAATPAQGTGS
ncbi:MAG: lysophospholipase [Gammaproteobacteria bacterium]|nr:lysophospholipase [Gammaproteobacteria bacterium]MDH5272717.1 lysophospholipase [Gammaproteobacteria bacterium]